MSTINNIIKIYNFIKKQEILHLVSKLTKSLWTQQSNTTKLNAKLKKNETLIKTFRSRFQLFPKSKLN